MKSGRIPDRKMWFEAGFLATITSTDACRHLWTNKKIDNCELIVSHSEKKFGNQIDGFDYIKNNHRMSFI